MNPSTGTVVVGIDGSTSATRALDWAVSRALAERRALTLVHALGNPTPTWGGMAFSSPDVAAPVDRILDEGLRVVAEARQHATSRGPGLEIRQVVEYADPTQLLLQHSRTAALLVLGSRGRGPVRSTLLGSVGVAVARHSSCPVVVHRPSHRGAVRNGVLAACDARPESLPILEFAFHEASLARLPLTVLHCHWDVRGRPTAGYVLEGATVDLETERLELSEAMAGLREKYPDVPTTVEHSTGTPDIAIAAAGARMDLVVVGNHHTSLAHQLVAGSVSLAVLEHTRAPVAVVPVGHRD